MTRRRLASLVLAILVIGVPSAVAAAEPVEIRLDNALQLTVDIDPDLPDDRAWSFILQRRGRDGWRYAGRYRTQYGAETRRIDVPPGAYRVVVPAQNGHALTVSEPLAFVPLLARQAGYLLEGTVPGLAGLVEAPSSFWDYFGPYFTILQRAFGTPEAELALSVTRARKDVRYLRLRYFSAHNHNFCMSYGVGIERYRAGTWVAVPGSGFTADVTTSGTWRDLSVDMRVRAGRALRLRWVMTDRTGCPDGTLSDFFAIAEIHLDGIR